MSSNIQSRRVRSAVSKSNIETKTPSRTNQLIDAAHIVAKTQLIPMARQMARNAVSFDRREIFYYFKKTIGRECSCITENNMPAGGCQICYKTGWVGGFDKFGTVTEILDVSASFSAVNVGVNYVNRPNTIELDKDCVYGYCVWEVPMKQNMGGLDLLQIIDYQEHGQIKYYVQNGLVWDVLSNASLIPRLGQTKIVIKAEFFRNNTQIEGPKLTCLRVRYNLRSNLWVYSDWESVRDSRALADYGIFQNWSTAQINIDDAIPMIRPEDWMYRSDRNERWKIIEAAKFDQLQLLTGTNITARLVQPHEVYQKISL